MNVSPAGRGLIVRNEGLRLRAYQDIAGVWTIGYGQTGPGIGPDTVWTGQQADDALTFRLSNEFGPAVSELCGTHPTTQGQFDAMVSLAYNIGTGYAHHHSIPHGGFANSSVIKHHVAGEFVAAADAFLAYNHAGGRAVAALTRRRYEERALYLSAPAKPTADPIVELQMAVQRALADAGFYHSEIDGWPGTDTYSAMGRYRKARGV